MLRCLYWCIGERVSRLRCGIVVRRCAFGKLPCECVVDLLRDFCVECGMEPAGFTCFGEAGGVHTKICASAGFLSGGIEEYPSLRHRLAFLRLRYAHDADQLIFRKRPAATDAPSLRPLFLLQIFILFRFRLSHNLAYLSYFYGNGGWGNGGDAGNEGNGRF